MYLGLCRGEVCSKRTRHSPHGCWVVPLREAPEFGQGQVLKITMQGENENGVSLLCDELPFVAPNSQLITESYTPVLHMSLLCDFIFISTTLIPPVRQNSTVNIFSFTPISPADLGGLGPASPTAPRFQNHTTFRQKRKTPILSKL